MNTIFTDTTKNGISQIFKSRGKIHTKLIGIPLIVSYHYSTLKIPLGANNYFRICFDKQRFIENQKKKLKRKILKLKSIKNRLQEKKADLLKVQGYTEVFLDMLRRKVKNTLKQNEKQVKKKLKDSTKVISKKYLEQIKEKRDSLLYTKVDSLSLFKKDSIIQSKEERSQKVRNKTKNKINRLRHEYSHIMSIYDKILGLRKKYEQINKKYNQYEKHFKELFNKYKSGSLSKTAISKGKNELRKWDYISGIKKFNLGLTYSKTTGLSEQTVAIKGIGTEFQFGKFYLRASSGVTLNNLMLSTNEITNQLKNHQNAFNHFEFQKIKNNGLLTTIKTGWGKPKNNHAFIGFNYLTNTRFFTSSTNMSSYDPAASIELDFQYVPKFYNGGKLNLVYGKTSANNKIDSIHRKDVFGTLFSNYPSNTYLIKYSQRASIIRSHFSLQYRSIDPFANTSVYGVLQPGNKQIKFQSKHRISPFLKIGTVYKWATSFGKKNSIVFNTYGINAAGSYTKYLYYSAMFNFVRYKTENFEQILKKRNNYIVGLHLGTNFKILKLRSKLDLNYNDYLFSDSIKVNKFTNFGIKETFGRRKWKGLLTYQYFYKASQSMVTGTNLFGIGGQYKIDPVKIKVELKVAQTRNEKASIGGGLDLSYRLSKFLTIKTHAERFVMGNFYRHFYRGLYERFPYLISMNAIFKF